MANTLNVKILTPTQTIFDGEALSVSSKSGVGNFDILPYHANFIALVQNQAIYVRLKLKHDENENKSLLSMKAFDDLMGKNIQKLVFNFPIAIIYTKDNFVKIYTDIQSHFNKDEKSPAGQPTAPAIK